MNPVRNYKFQLCSMNKIMDIPTQKISNGVKKVFITGAAGFVGSHLVRKLIKDGYGVHILIRPSTDLERIHDVVPSINLHTGDLADRDGIRRILHGIKPDGIFHLAVSTIASGVTAPADDVIKSNFLGTVNLIDAVRDIDIKFFINTGSFMEYGSKSVPAKESDLCEPMELYSITKLAGTLYASAMAQSAQKPIITFRLLTPYGPFIQKERLIYQVIASALKGSDISLTEPHVARDFIFVDDIVSLYQEAADNAQKFAGKVFNLGSGKLTTINKLLDCVLQYTASSSKVKWGDFPSVSYDKRMWLPDMEKTFSHFSWRPKVTLEDGLEKTIEWYKAFNQT